VYTEQQEEKSFIKDGKDLKGRTINGTSLTTKKSKIKSTGTLNVEHCKTLLIKEGTHHIDLT
jgi:hypothetical protein